MAQIFCCLHLNMFFLSIYLFNFNLLLLFWCLSLVSQVLLFIYFFKCDKGNGRVDNSRTSQTEFIAFSLQLLGILAGSEDVSLCWSIPNRSSKHLRICDNCGSQFSNLFYNCRYWNCIDSTLVLQILMLLWGAKVQAVSLVLMKIQLGVDVILLSWWSLLKSVTLQLVVRASACLLGSEETKIIKDERNKPKKKKLSSMAFKSQFNHVLKFYFWRLSMFTFLIHHLLLSDKNHDHSIHALCDGCYTWKCETFLILHWQWSWTVNPFGKNWT